MNLEIYCSHHWWEIKVIYFFPLLPQLLTFFYCPSSRSSNWMLWWTGEQIPATRLLPFPSRQHDWGTLRRARRFRSRLGGGGSVHGQRWRPRLRRGVSASPTTLHRTWPQAGGPLYRHSGHDEATSTKSGGRTGHNPALVFLRSAPNRQAALGPAQHLQRLRSAGHPQPAASARFHSRTYTRGLRSRWRWRSGCTITRTHTCGELTGPNLEPGRGLSCEPADSKKEDNKGGKRENCELCFCLFSSFSLVLSSQLFFASNAEEVFVGRASGCLSAGAKGLSKLRKGTYFLVLHVEILTFFEVFLTVPMETKQQEKENCVWWLEGFS